MKRIFIIAVTAICFAACNNESKNDQSGTDTANSVVLPENRSSDSLAIPSDSLTTPRRDSAGMRKDSAR